MSRLWQSGAEIDGVATGTGTRFELNGAPSSSVTRDTVTFRSGLASFKCDSGVGNAASNVALGGSTRNNLTEYARAFINFTNLPGSTVVVFGVGIAPFLSARLTSAGKLQLWNETAGTQIGSDSAATIATGTWYRIEVKTVYNATPQCTEVELRLDGVTVASTTGLALTPTVGYQIGWQAAPGASKVCYIDDLAVNNSSGASNNSWCGDGKIVLLRPTADSAIGTGWTNSGGNTTNIFDSVDNTPPIGVADTTANNGKQIRNASNAAASYDATMTTYAAVGVGASDTVNAIIPYINTGAPIVTGAKTGSVGVVSNPTIANIAFVNGASAAANFWQGTTAGTYPTGWKWEKGTLTEAPSVTVGTAPVMRVTITGGTATRIAMVDAMFMSVDYTPVAAASPVDAVAEIVLQAVNRNAVW